MMAATHTTAVPGQTRGVALLVILMARLSHRKCWGAIRIFSGDGPFMLRGVCSVAAKKAVAPNPVCCVAAVVLPTQGTP